MILEILPKGLVRRGFAKFSTFVEEERDRYSRKIYNFRWD
jgi:hypothetical protein